MKKSSILKIAVIKVNESGSGTAEISPDLKNDVNQEGNANERSGK